MQARGKFIVLEGPDGSGKSTQLELLKKHFAERAHEFVFTREPGGTSLGEKVRQLILKTGGESMCAESEALLYAASRAELAAKVILPSLEQGKHVLCDRFLLSSLAYQGYGRDLGIDRVLKLNEFGLKGLRPDATLFFRVDAAYSLGRKGRGSAGRDRLEEEGTEFHRKVFDGYMALLEHHDSNMHVIRADRPIRAVHKEVVRIVETILKGVSL